jgi:hypothetical protein
MNELTALLFAHMIGDFLLQPTSWVLDIERQIFRSKYLYLHAFIHGILVWMLTGYTNPWLAILIAIVHLMIDVAKLFFQTPISKTYWFFLDQALHILSLYLINYYYLGNQEVVFASLLKISMGTWAALFFLTTPSAYLIKTLLGHWSEKFTLDNENSRPLAGLVIGVLERILIFVFIMMGSVEAVGFLLTAKSVFRFGDLTNAKDRMLTEYILVGTLLSFSIAIITTLALKYAI